MLIDLDATATQAEFARITGIDQAAVSRMVGTVLTEGDSLQTWIQALLKHRGELAAGRSGGLASERERVARAQAERIERENALKAAQLIPADQFTAALADVAAQMVPILEGLPGRIRKRAPAATVAMIKVVEDEVIRARNLLAALEPRPADVPPGHP
jgi:phage terminase Nu1 subunit (DNA packaging protein)